MRKFIIILITLLCVSCCPYKTLQPSVQTIQRDSIIYIERLDTIQVPVIKEKLVVEALSDSSHLETSIAYSDAFVKDGKLTHILENKDVKITGTVKVEEKIVYKDKIVEKEVPVPVEVVKTKYPRIFWGLLVFFIGVVGWRLFKVFKYVI